MELQIVTSNRFTITVLSSKKVALSIWQEVRAKATSLRVSQRIRRWRMPILQRWLRRLKIIDVTIDGLCSGKSQSVLREHTSSLDAAKLAGCNISIYLLLPEQMKKQPLPCLEIMPDGNLYQGVSYLYIFEEIIFTWTSWLIWH